MKLIPAKCPSCGASLKVNGDEKKFHCEYCDTDILVDDAIERYGYDKTTKVEIENIPKLNSYIKLAMMHYNDNEYEEAYNEFSKAVELDPDNFTLILRKGICKSLMTNYARFDINSSINAFNNSVKILEKNNADQSIINSVIIETKSVFDRLVLFAKNFYDSNRLDRDSTIEYIDKLFNCVHAYDLLISKAPANSVLLDNLINSEVSLIDYLLLSKRYFLPGGKIGTTSIAGDRRNLLYNAKQRILMLRRPETIERERVIKSENTKRQNMILCIIASVLLFILAIAGLVESVVTFIFAVMAALLFIPPISDILKNKVNINGVVIIVFRVLLSFIALCAFAVNHKYSFNGTFRNTDNIIVELSNTEMKITINEKTDTYSIFSNSIPTGYSITTSNNEYTMTYNDSSKELCIKIGKKEDTSTTTTKTTTSKNKKDDSQKNTKVCDYLLKKDN